MSFARNFYNKYRKQLLDIGLDSLKTASKTMVYKAAEATSEFIGNKIANKIVKTLRNIEEIIIPLEKREEILSELKQVL